MRRQNAKEKQQFAKSSCVVHIGSNETNVMLFNDSAELLGDKRMITKVLDNSAKKKKIQLSSL